MKRFEISRKKAYTLAEVVIVMLVVAVIVGVSIKITKAKLDNIVSYTYYSGYSTLRGITAQMLKDFKATDESYTDVAYMRLFPFLSKFGSQRAYALSNKPGEKEKPDQYQNIKCDRVKCPYGCVRDYVCLNKLGPSGPSIPDNLGEVGEEKILCNTPSAERIEEMRCKGKVFNKNTLGCWDDVANWNVCPTGQHWNNATTGCGCVDDEHSGGGGCNLTEEQKRTAYCSGKEYNMETCNLQDRSPLCENDIEYRWDEATCGCVPVPATIPREGQNFCEKFVAYANTRSGSLECSGTRIDAALTDFTNQTPDITLRNGMRLYNVRQNPSEIAVLANNTPGASYDGVPNVNTFGYTVYLDIDGVKGPSTLWQDVYPFYITMAGKVIPAYDMTVNADEVGGNSRQHLMTSVENETVDATGHRKLYWVSKSVSFKEGACSSGYIGAATPYCNGVELKQACSGENVTCVLKHISPIKLFQ